MRKKTDALIRLSLEEVYECLDSVKPGLGAAVDEFVKNCLKRGIYRGTGSTKNITLHYKDKSFGKLSFGRISRDGFLDTQWVCHFTENAGDLSAGEEYLDGLAALIPGGEVKKQGTPTYWKVVVGDGEIPLIGNVLPRYSDEWLALIDKTLARFRHRG